MSASNCFQIILGAVFLLAQQESAFPQNTFLAPIWSTETTINLPSVGTRARHLEVQEQRTVVRVGGADLSLKRLFAPSLGAAWIGPEDYKFCIVENTVIGFRMFSRNLLMRRGTTNALAIAHVDTLSNTYVRGLRSLLINEQDNDLGVDLAAAFGMEEIIGHRTRPLNWAEILDVSTTDDDVQVSLRTATGQRIVLTLDKTLTPWKAAVEDREILILGACTYDPKAAGKFPWAFPTRIQVKSHDRSLEATSRAANIALERDRTGVEKPFSLVLTEDGRVWLGPSDTDVVLSDSGLVGFVLEEDGYLAATVCSERLPMTRDSIRIFRAWVQRMEQSLLAGNHGRRRITDLRSVRSLAQPQGGERLTGGAIRATRSNDGIDVAMGSAEGQFFIKLNRDLSLSTVVYTPHSQRPPTDDDAFRCDAP